jgi:hypothetical protein
MSDNASILARRIKPFIFDTVAKQNAANTLTYNVASTGRQQFKDDYSRMQYLLGLNAINAGVCNAANNCLITK